MKKFFISCVFLTSCMAAMTQGFIDENVIRIAQFETNCGQMQIVDQMMGSDMSTRYKISGCGREYIYICKNEHQMGSAEILIEGSRSLKQECRRKN